jgi:hypothetical protein
LIVHQTDLSLNQQIPIIRRDIKRSIISPDRNEDEQMDIDHDNGSETYEDHDDITGLSRNNSTTTVASGITSNQQPLSEFKFTKLHASIDKIKNR